MSLNGKDITNLTGIQDFDSLVQLQVFMTQLTSLDVSSNSKLSVLDCGYSQLTYLYLGANTSLTELWCDSNYLTELNISQNTSLTELVCGINQLRSLDLTNNTALTKFYCWKNELECLNMGTSQPGTFQATSNPALSCIEVSDTAWAAMTWTVAGFDIDSTVAFSLDCDYPVQCGSIVPSIKDSRLLKRQLVLITDLLGRVTGPMKNTILFYIYADGTVEKRIIIE